MSCAGALRSSTATPAESWQIDFPAHFTAQEAALYEKPFARVLSAGSWHRSHANPGSAPGASARLSRYLAMPADADGTRLALGRGRAVARRQPRRRGARGRFHARHPVVARVCRVARRASHADPAGSCSWSPSRSLGRPPPAQRAHGRPGGNRVTPWPGRFEPGIRDLLNEAVARAYGWPADLTADELVERICKHCTATGWAVECGRAFMLRHPDRRAKDPRGPRAVATA